MGKRNILEIKKKGSIVYPEFIFLLQEVMFLAGRREKHLCIAMEIR